MADVKGSARREKAEATRRKILRAAHAEFLAAGYHGATMAAIAKRAGVAVQTVYFVFHTKADLISAVIDAAVLGDDPTPPEATAWWSAMEAEPHADETLRLFVRGAAPLFERASAVSEVLRGAALTDPEVRRTHEHHEGLRRAGFLAVVTAVAAKGRLHDGLDVERATDVLLTVFGDAVWHQLRTEHSWSPEQIERWFCDALPLLLLAPEATTATRSASRSTARGRQPRGA